MNFPVIKENVLFFMVILFYFQLFVWLKYWRIEEALSQHFAAKLSPISYLTK